MNKLCRLIRLGCVIAFTITVLIADDSTLIDEPIRDFLTFVKPHGEGTVLELRLDLQGNGKEAIFLGWSDNADGRAGNIWTVYTPVDDSYVRHNDACIFRRDAYFLGTIDAVEGKILLTYFPGSATEGSLRGYQYDGNAITELNLGKIEPLGKDVALYDTLFGVPSEFSVIEHDPAELQKLLKASALPEQGTSVVQPPNKLTSPTNGSPASSALVSELHPGSLNALGLVTFILGCALLFAVLLRRRRPRSR